jgi:hypothetical protein
MLYVAVQRSVTNHELSWSPTRSGIEQAMQLQTSHQCDQVSLFLCCQFQFKNQVEELDGVFEGQQTPIVEVPRRVFDAAQRKRLRATGRR